ncbi:MAG: hypothetical protein MUC69_04530 [Gemmatimonadales bacterium]|jgi:hypothetical protein|nr:hypothetical protein [Gemmatimonadales bacterium]
MDRFAPFLAAWRVQRVGPREMIDAVVAPEHRGPSAELRAALGDWAGTHYWLATDRSRLLLLRDGGALPRQRWLRHGILFLLTVLCALGAGAMLAGAWMPWSGPGLAGAVAGAVRFLVEVPMGAWREILPGWSFALPLLGILLCHEFGHYLTARRYRIDASLPYFLPVPPPLSPIGSLGAFIRLRSPVLDRRQLLDVGAAGPIAGFVAAIPVLLWGYAISRPSSGFQLEEGDYVFFAGQLVALGDSVVTWALRHAFFGDAAALHLSLPAFAGWVGIFVTGLNLLPLSQLDGGHVLYGLLGRRQAMVGLATVVALFALAQRSPSWYVWVLIALFLGGGGWSHPAVVAPEWPVPASRKLIGWICVALFALTFIPVPFRS